MSLVHIRSYGRKVMMLSCIFISAAAHSQSVEKLLTGYFGEVRKGTYPPIPKPLTISENSSEVLKLLPVYLKDSVINVRSKAYTIASLAGSAARQAHVRETAVTQLVHALKDADGGNAGSALDYLSSFRQQDFTPTAKDSIRALLMRKAMHLEKIVRLCGFLEMTDVKDQIRPYTLAGNNQGIRWSALVSLARMGDEAASSEVVRRARRQPVSDDVVYSVFPDLVFTRDRGAIDYMIEVLNRDDANCMSADAERQAAIPCGYRVMEQLAPIIKGYPLTLDASGDIKTNDYVAALKTVREWFTKHPNYEILKDKY